MQRLRLTAAQAMVRFLANQFVETDEGQVPYFGGVWAIFGHGNVAGLGEALEAAQDRLPTFRAHNEQGMANAAIAFAKQLRRQRAMICTTSIGPGATNMVTSAALAHVNRLPVLFVPGDVFANRRPGPVLQEIEDFSDATVSANDCFRPVSRYFDRIVRAEQILDALPRAMATLFDPVNCGPVTLAFCQDVQTEAFDYPEAFFERRVWRFRASPADPVEVDALAALIRNAKAPVIVCGGGVRYAMAEDALGRFVARTGIPFVETQAGKGALPWDHPNNLGAVGVTGTAAANDACAAADLVIGVGTRLQDFTTASRSLFENENRTMVQVNVAAFDAHKQGSLPVVGDARRVLETLDEQLKAWTAPADWIRKARTSVSEWFTSSHKVTAPGDGRVTDAQILKTVWDASHDNAVVVCAAGGLPGELHKLWRTKQSGGYHVEYGYSCMGYEVAAGLGVKMAQPDREVHVMVGDGSYLMLNSELATSVMLGRKIIVTLIDNGGYGCINRLQQHTGGAAFNNLFVDATHTQLPTVDFAAHATALGAAAEKVTDLDGLRAALSRAQASDRSYVIVIEADPAVSTQEGGAWWDVAVPEVSERAEVTAARKSYDEKTKHQRVGY
jgi:3D-(3,5/4)-trihydroxycyclohexane-1,2-dione acylhydrolase (decyclizing)